MPAIFVMEQNSTKTQAYRHIFFDLDHTLWDFDANSEETLRELYESYSLCDLGVEDAMSFIETYIRINHALWERYHLGQINKQELRNSRFHQTFVELGLQQDCIPADIEDAYLSLCPTKTNLFPYTHEILTYLRERYCLHLISNGFVESTTTKIDCSGLRSYFDTIVISDGLGVNKPDKAIFEHALQGAGARKKESVMIGDSLEADIKGALNFGMDAVYFNPKSQPVPEYVTMHIAHLQDLLHLF